MDSIFWYLLCVPLTWASVIRSGTKLVALPVPGTSLKNGTIVVQTRSELAQSEDQVQEQHSVTVKTPAGTFTFSNASQHPLQESLQQQISDRVADVARHLDPTELVDMDVPARVGDLLELGKISSPAKFREKIYGSPLLEKLIDMMQEKSLELYSLKNELEEKKIVKREAVWDAADGRLPVAGGNGQWILTPGQEGEWSSPAGDQWRSAVDIVGQWNSAPYVDNQWMPVIDGWQPKPSLDEQWRLTTGVDSQWNPTPDADNPWWVVSGTDNQWMVAPPTDTYWLLPCSNKLWGLTPDAHLQNFSSYMPTGQTGPSLQNDLLPTALIPETSTSSGVRSSSARYVPMRRRRLHRLHLRPHLHHHPHLPRLLLLLLTEVRPLLKIPRILLSSIFRGPRLLHPLSKYHRRPRPLDRLQKHQRGPPPPEAYHPLSFYHQQAHPQPLPDILPEVASKGYAGVSEQEVAQVDHILARVHQSPDTVSYKYISPWEGIFFSLFRDLSLT